MKTFFALTTAMLCVVSIPVARGHTSEVSDKGCTAFSHVTVVDPSDGGLQTDVTVLVCGKKIRSVTGNAAGREPNVARVVDARGKYMVPGLWDFHVHLALAGQSAGPLFLLNGVTSVRDCGSNFAVLHDWRDQIAAGTVAGPRIKGAGAIFESPHFLQVISKI